MTLKTYWENPNTPAWILAAIDLVLNKLPHEMNVSQLHLIADASQDGNFYNELILKHKWDYSQVVDYAENIKALLRQWKLGGNIWS